MSGNIPPRDEQNVKKKEKQSESLFTLSNGAKKFMKDYRTSISSGVASSIATGGLFPLDFLKSRMQIFETKLVPTIQDAYRAEGIRTFWRGVLPPLVSVTLVRTASFSIYQMAKYQYSAWIETNMTGESPLAIANEKDRYPTWSTAACFGLSGATTGGIISVIASPFELTKLSAQLAGKVNRQVGPGSSAAINDLKRTAWRAAYQLFQQRGIRGLYAGYIYHLIRDTVGTGVYFATYESAKQALANGRGKSPTDLLAVGSAGALCGVVSWSCTYPIDVAKTVYQKSLLTSGGKYVPWTPIQFFRTSSYRGLIISCTRSALVNMVFLSLFETFKMRINNLEIDD